MVDRQLDPRDEPDASLLGTARCLIEAVEGVDTCVAPPYPYLSAVVEALRALGDVAAKGLTLDQRMFDPESW